MCIYTDYSFNERLKIQFNSFPLLILHGPLILIFVVSIKEFNLLINQAFETKYRDSKSKWIRNENIRRTIQVLSFLYLSLLYLEK